MKFELYLPHLYLFPTRLLKSEDECKWFWHQMIYFPGTINIVSIRLYCHTYITMNLFFILQLCTSTLTLCMLAFWSHEGVVFLVLSSSSHLTVGHVFPLPMSGANWRPLSLLWGSPPSPNMAPSSTGSAHTPFLGYKTIPLASAFKICWEICGRGKEHACVFLRVHCEAIFVSLP
jgi:hypothetical protein